MALEQPTLDIVNEAPKKLHKIDNETLDFVFGKQDSQDSKTADGIELINNEKNHNIHNGNNGTDNSRFPLLDPDRDQQKPPLAGPEADDLDGDSHLNGGRGNGHGIDDGLLNLHGDKPPITIVGDLDDDKTEPELHDDGVGTEEDGKWPWMGGDEPDYPYDNHLTPRFGLDDRPTSPVPTIIDVNTYQQKKNLAQGMMDLALLSANANQLRYVVESASSHPYFYPSLVFITLSIIFQVAVGIGLILNSRYDVNDKKEICKADKINNFTVLGIFLITIVNVFITSFSVASPTVTVVQSGP